jgi:hypothetical protein
MAEEGFKRKLTAILSADTAILSADVEGYSRLMADDEEATVRTLTTYLVNHTHSAGRLIIKCSRGIVVIQP